MERNSGQCFIIQPHISKPTDKIHTNAIRIFWVTISSVSICEDRLVRESYTFFLFDEEAFCTLTGNELGYWRRSLDVGSTSVRKDGETTQWLVRLLTSLLCSINLKQRIWGPGHTACIWKKEKTYKTYQEKLKLIFKEGSGNLSSKNHFSCVWSETFGCHIMW